MKKRPSSTLRWMALRGLAATGVARVMILFTASPVPDPTSGRTEPSLFAPAISTNWDYITPTEAWLLILLTGATLICVVAWPILAWLERRADAGRSGLRPGMPPLTGRAVRILGRRGR